MTISTFQVYEFEKSFVLSLLLYVLTDLEDTKQYVFPNKFDWIQIYLISLKDGTLPILFCL